MGNNCCSINYNTHNTYISLVSDLYKRRKNNVHRHMTQKNIKNIYENEQFDTIYISPKIENLLSPKENIPFVHFVIQGGSACNSPTLDTNISLIVPMDNYVRYESDKSDDEFIVI